MDGFYGRILRVDLTEKRFDVEAVDDDILRATLGGKGLGSHLLLKLNPPGADPLSPENHLIFATGPACGSLIWGGCRYGVFTKSPQTGFYSESYAGGRVPEAMDAAGYDAVVIRGESRHPTVMVVNPGGVTFHDAGGLWGTDTHQAQEGALRGFGEKKNKKWRTGAVVVGPAAEHGVCFSVIENDYWRSAGRTGAGAVMGGKKLKAIVFQGDCKRRLANSGAVKILARQFATEAKEHPAVQAYKAGGTPMMVKVMNEAGGFPTRYWSEGTYEKWPRISADALHERCDVRPRACLKCFMACGRMTKVRHGRHAGLRLEGPEYETIYAFGGLCLVDSIEEIAYLNDICDRLGMDTITAGNLCGLTIEAARRGKIDDPIDYGDVDGIADLLNKIAFCKGIGSVLAKGIRTAARAWDLEDIAVHVKGLEPAGYDPRVLKGVGLGYATSGRGACHLRATFYKPELSGMIAPDAVHGKAAMFVDFEDRLTLFDALILCRFYRDLYPWEMLSEIIEALTGIESGMENLKAVSARISDTVRTFNMQEGLTRRDDQLPARFYKEALQGDRGITEAELEQMLTDYYGLRGWDEEGRPKMA